MIDKDAAAERAEKPATEDRENANPEESAGNPESASAGDIESLRREAEENWSRYLRAVAELDNLRKRNARDVENARKYGAERLVAAILPVRDSLEAGLKAASEADPGAIDVGALLEGERATLRLLEQAFEAVGIAEIDPEGEPFDPERHEAMSMLPSATAEPNSIIAVIQKGYSLNERVVRPARVVVAQTPPDGAGSDGA